MTAVSIIIPTYNRAMKVTRALKSVLDQTYDDFEIIVVDDGSADETLYALEPFKKFVNLITLSQNQGASEARNAGIRAARASLIAFLDSDDTWLPEKLATQVPFFDEHPDAMACQTNEIWIRRGRRVNPQKKHIKPTGNIFELSLKRCLVSPSAVMLKKTLFNEVGLFDPGLPACEDYDLWLRISCRYPIHLIDKNLVIREGGHRGQLSARFKGMDRFRIQSMVKLMESGVLGPEQRSAVLKELSIKCRIYGNGCLKRGKDEEGQYYLDLPRNLTPEEPE